MIERESVENRLEIWQLAPLWGFLMWGVSSLITQTERRIRRMPELDSWIVIL